MHADSGKTVGFLNKVMHLVRGQHRVSAEITEADSLSAREVLQESMVRKRRNEAIRKHEFAQLRLLRQRNEADGRQPVTMMAKDDDLSSLLGQEIRSTQTLQKIDAIEAQMSGQWWRSPAQTAAKGDKHAAPRKPTVRQLTNLPVLGEDSVVHAMTHRAGVSTAQATPTVAQPFKPPSLSPSMLPAHEVEHAPEQVQAVAVTAFAQISTSPTFSEFQPCPELEEAAILFAHGDLAGARTRLLEQLVQALSAQTIDDAKALTLWHAVLDWCRATGDEEGFEPLAIDYAEHFGRSAPLWNSMPAQLGLPTLYGVAPAAMPAQSSWVCPQRLTHGGVMALRQWQADAPQPSWSLQWQRCMAIDEDAVLPLAQLLQAWAGSPGQCLWSGTQELLQIVEQRTVVGDPNNAAAWWLLRMAVLRLMHRMETYEQVALDYCVTYEVSPPSWAEPQCQCSALEEAEADVTLLQQSTWPGRADHQKGFQSSWQAQAGAGVSLSGVLEGDLQAQLDALAAHAQQGQMLEIACEHLIRLDFVAAGSLLNWAAQMQAQGHRLRFTQLHQLVAVFLGVIGIHEHASVERSTA